MNIETIVDLLILLLAFVSVWLGSGLIVKSVEKLSTKLHTSSFVISFFLLGFITSITEMSVAFNSLLNDEVEVSVGNLMGGMLVLFLFVIPLLGILGNGVKLNHDLSSRNLLLCIIVVLTPALLLIDKNVNLWEGILVLLFYCGVGYRLYREETVLEKVKDSLVPKPKVNAAQTVLSIIAGGIILIASCNILVKETIDFASDLGVSTFIISLLLLAVGTNLPEITLAVQSIVRGRRDIAFGNYIGSAMFNTVIFAVLVMIKGGIAIQADFLKVFGFLSVGLVCFFLFSRSRNELSRGESLILSGIYGLFIATEIVSI